MHDAVKSFLLGTAVGRATLVLPRAAMAFRAARILPRIGAVAAWSVRSREVVNFTYSTTRENELLLCATVAQIARRDIRTVIGFRDELFADRELIDYIESLGRRGHARWQIDPGFMPGRRIPFYLLVRCLKPGLVVEAGVDRGLGALLISRALQRNADEGAKGDYLGIELSETKQIQLYDQFPGRIGRIVRGDSVEVVRKLDRQVDFFIHETIPDAGHVEAQLAALMPLLSPRGVIMSPWPTEPFIRHAIERDLGLLTHQEQPLRHWFDGDRITFVFGRGRGAPR